ncbi:MAG TPA: hypothetical protein VGR25_08120 [bacterium]|nr:hypothetical protein [bacterium]
MTPFSRLQADALLAPLRGGRALYDELRPAYVSLDPFITLLRRRRFSGVILAAGDSGEGALWLEEGRFSGAWLFPPGAQDAAVPSDPVEVLRMLWGDADARVTVHPGAPLDAVSVPSVAAPARETSPEEAHPGEPAHPLLPLPAPRRRPPRAAPTAVAPEAPAGLRQVASGQQSRLRAAERVAPDDPALAGVPWPRLLPETVARVRRHRGTPLARRLEEAINTAIAPAELAGREVRGEIDPRRAAAALRAVADGLGAVAGAAFAERLLWTVGRDFACEDAVKRLLGAVRQDGGA